MAASQGHRLVRAPQVPRHHPDAQHRVRIGAAYPTSTAQRVLPVHRAKGGRRGLPADAEPAVLRGGRARCLGAQARGHPAARRRVGRVRRQRRRPHRTKERDLRECERGCAAAAL
eukprot:ctg_2954.g400